MYEDFTDFSNEQFLPNHPVRVHRAGISYCDGSYRCRRWYRSIIFVFEYIVSGRGTLETDGRVFHPEAGDVYIVDGSKPSLYYSSSNEPWVKIWFNTSGILVRQMLNSYGIANVTLFRRMPVEELFRQGLETLRRDPSRVDSLAGPVIHGLIAAIAEQYHKSGNRYEVNPGVLRVKEFIDSGEGAIPKLAEMCKVASLSAAQLIRLFRRVYGITPYAYALSKRIDKAEFLLLNTDMSIKHIAHELGFSDEFYFSGEFKAARGISPSVYRRGSQVTAYDPLAEHDREQRRRQEAENRSR